MRFQYQEFLAARNISDMTVEMTQEQCPGEVDGQQDRGKRQLTGEQRENLGWGQGAVGMEGVDF